VSLDAGMVEISVNSVGACERKVADVMASRDVEEGAESGRDVSADDGRAVREAEASVDSLSVPVEQEDEEAAAVPCGVSREIVTDEIHVESRDDSGRDFEGVEIGSVGIDTTVNSEDRGIGTVGIDAVTPGESGAVEARADVWGGRGGSVRVMTDGLDSVEEAGGIDVSELGQLVDSNGEDDAGGDGGGQIVTQEASAELAVGPGRVRDRANGTGFHVVRVMTDDGRPGPPGTVEVNTTSVNESVMAVTCGV